MLHSSSALQEVKNSADFWNFSMQTGSCSLWIENWVLDYVVLLARGAENFFVLPKGHGNLAQKLAWLCLRNVWSLFLGTKQLQKYVTLSLVACCNTELTPSTPLAGGQRSPPLSRVGAGSVVLCCLDGRSPGQQGLLLRCRRCKSGQWVAAQSETKTRQSLLSQQLYWVRIQLCKTLLWQ